MDSHVVTAVSDPTRYQQRALNDFTNIMQQEKYL